MQTARLELRRFTPDDVDLIVALDSDPAVMHYITGGRATSRDEVVTEVLPAWLAYYERSDHLGFFAAHERATGEFVGWFHFRPGVGRADEEPELGYRLRRASWGSGLATEGSRALIDRGFREHAVTRVDAGTMVVNTASRRVMEKCGMRLVRHFRADWPDRIPGDEHGDVEYAITLAEWTAAPRARDVQDGRSPRSRAT